VARRGTRKFNPMEGKEKGGKHFYRVRRQLPSGLGVRQRKFISKEIFGEVGGYYATLLEEDTYMDERKRGGQKISD